MDRNASFSSLSCCPGHIGCAIARSIDDDVDRNTGQTKRQTGEASADAAFFIVGKNNDSNLLAQFGIRPTR